ncbi:hypothetical protein B0H19DRAFT_956933, partial [Mycena capillaripes]
KIGTIQRRLAWPLHKDDTLFRSGRPTGLNIYALFFKDLTTGSRTMSVHTFFPRREPGNQYRYPQLLSVNN